MIRAAFLGLLSALAVAAAVCLTGCISSAPIVPVTPDNQAQVASCQSDAALHNGVVIGDFVLGAGATSLATVAAAVSDTGAKTDLAIAGAVTAGLLAAGAGVANLTAANFANSQCSQVVGPLPAKPAPAPAPPASPAGAK